MAQQTINVGTAPNDGTGTPLRTAFQYTNSNFSELYTAVGPSGNNIVVPGTATITGDLTVATSVLKVDTANTRVGINTTSINGGPFNVKISPAIDAKFVVQDGFTTGNVRLAAVDNAYSTYKIMDFSALSYAWYNSGTTAMTLNSTGLGVGGSPSTRFEVFSGFIKNTATTGSAQIIANNTGGVFTLAKDSSTGGNFTGTAYASVLYSDGAYPVCIFSNGSERLRIDSSGNLGIAVTPSAWGAGGNIQGTNGFIWSSYDASVGAGYYYASGSYKYISTAAASIYQPFGGTHKWFTAAGGQPAGTNFTPTQAMTLDASGQLGIGVTTPTYKLDTQVAGGADRSILRAAVTGVSGGFNVNWNHATLKTRVIIENIPTSSAGLPAGTLWNDAGTIKIA